MTALTGGGVRLNIQWEDTYGSVETSPSPFVPGANARLTTREATNNGTRVTLPASQVSVDIVEGVFDGSWALEWGLTNPWMFRSIYGTPSTVDNGDGSYTHTYSLGDPDSFQILVGYETSQNDESTIKGCVTARATIDPTVGQGDVVPVVMEGFYADAPDLATSASLTAQDTLDEDILDFGDAVVTLGGNDEAIVQDASLELAWDPIEPTLAFGSRFATDFMAGLFDPTITYSKVKQDSDAMQDVYGSATTMQEDIENEQKFEMDFDNGVAAGSGINQVEFDGSGQSFPNAYSDAPIGDPRERVDETLDRLIENIDVVATNETSTPP